MRALISYSRSIRDYAEVITLAYGTRALQLVANVLLARTIADTTYTSYQTVQQGVLSLYFYFSAGITYSFSSSDVIAPKVKEGLLLLYGLLTLGGSVASVTLFAPISGGVHAVSATLLASAYILYSAFGLLNAIIVKHQLFRASTAAGLLTPLVILGLVMFKLTTKSTGPMLAVIATAAPLCALLLNPACVKAIRTELASWRQSSSFDDNETKSFKQRLALGIALAAPIAVQGGAYSAVLATAGYKSPTDAQALAMLLPLFSLLMIAPSSLINMILFQRSSANQHLVLGPMFIACICTFLAAPLLTDAVLATMKSSVRLNATDSFLFMAFCSLMVIAKILPALGYRKQERQGAKYVLATSSASLLILVVTVGFYASGLVSTWSSLVIIGLGMIAPYTIRGPKNAA